VAFFAALGGFAVLNVALYTARDLYQPSIDKAVLASNPNASVHRKEWSWWPARQWLEQKSAPDVVLFGSSQMNSAVCAGDAQYLFQAIDSLTHRRAALLEHDMQGEFDRPVTVFNLATPGAMCSDAYMESQALFARGLQPKAVIIGISPRDFIDNTLTYAAETEPYKFYSRFVGPGKLLKNAYHDVFSWLQCGIDYLPFRRLGCYLQNVASDVPADKEQSPEAHADALAAVLGNGMAEPGKWLVPANIPPMWVDNSKEYKNRFKNPNTPVYESEKAFFNAFLADMQEKKIAVIVVGMPTLPLNRQLLSHRFWQRFHTTVSNICAVHNAEYLDLSDSPIFVKADYLDTVHLNAQGGAKLFQILAKYAHADSMVTASLNQPPSNSPVPSGTETATKPVSAEKHL
jgi:hypothetical protein